MLANLANVLPIFALILTGYIARRSGALGPNATREINRLVITLALPALLFDIMAKAQPAQIWHPGFILAFTGGCALIYAATLALRLRQGSHLADAAIDGLNAGYANTGFMGFPLVLAIIGPAGMPGALVATIITVCILFAIAIILIESGLQAEGRRRDILRRTALSLVKNPLLIAPVLGAIFLVTGLPLPKPADSFLKLLGGAASPCALIALGLFLAQNAGRRPRAGVGVQSLLIGLKLIGQPLLTWLIAVPLLHLPHDLALTAVLLAALPTGTGPFMLAEFYEREALLTGRVVLLSTLLSLLTLPVLMALWPA
ncbi:AEC family transporter [Pseudooceanicola sp. CBS1P-1]|uniref:AEC family transporter n=1 Tax=Pseudooceanicola albus TaxID=2692189 RepID=A0A6L7G0E7_9RHOB|nr:MULTISPECIES: AEC family transporter [Pseudooceanicola]MBT9383701.1 AEC family transporter [Pseudooceanicola endophyticus]MXN17555.1 AEC family transporter [Pseudooceanicola albus]